MQNQRYLGENIFKMPWKSIVEKNMNAGRESLLFIRPYSPGFGVIVADILGWILISSETSRWRSPSLCTNRRHHPTILQISVILTNKKAYLG
jgi:hypothetical protein